MKTLRTASALYFGSTAGITLVIFLAYLLTWTDPA